MKSGFFELVKSVAMGAQATQSRAEPNTRRSEQSERSRCGVKGVAGDGAQTRDLRLGKATLYQLSYSREQ